MQPVGNAINVDRYNDLHKSRNKLINEKNDIPKKYIQSVGPQSFAYGFTSLNEAGAALRSTANVVLEKELPPDNVIRKINIIANLLKVALYLPIIGQIISIAGLILLKKFQESAIENSNATPDEAVLMQKELSKHFSHLKGRLIVSALGLGAVYLVPDLIFSIIYPCRLKKTDKEYNKLGNEIKKINSEIRALVESDYFVRIHQYNLALNHGKKMQNPDQKSAYLNNILKRINQAIQQEASNGTTDYSTKLLALQTRFTQELANLNS